MPIKINVSHSCLFFLHISCDLTINDLHNIKDNHQTNITVIYHYVISHVYNIINTA